MEMRGGTVRFSSSDPDFYVDVVLVGCWVRTAFRTDQLVTEYLWLWGSLFFMAILYTIMFAVMRGWFLIDNGAWHWACDNDISSSLKK